MGTDKRVVSLANRKAADQEKLIEWAREAYSKSKAEKDPASALRSDLIFAEQERL